MKLRTFLKSLNITLNLFAFSKKEKTPPWTNIKAQYIHFESSNDYKSIADMLNIQSRVLTMVYRNAYWVISLEESNNVSK